MHIPRPPPIQSSLSSPDRSRGQSARGTLFFLYKILYSSLLLSSHIYVIILHSYTHFSHYITLYLPHNTPINPYVPQSLPHVPHCHYINIIILNSRNLSMHKICTLLSLFTHETTSTHPSLPPGYCFIYSLTVIHSHFTCTILCPFSLCSLVHTYTPLSSTFHNYCESLTFVYFI